MIFFLVNNDYQLFDARRHAATLSEQGFSASLIEVPHVLNAARRSEGFVATTRFESPLVGRSWLAGWPRYFARTREVESTLRPAPGDTLFLYTEFELLNQVIALHFKRAGAKVLLVEDGGVATYIPFSLAGGERMSLKEQVIAVMTRCLPRLRKTRFHKVNGMVFPWLEDSRIDGICLYRPLEIVRDIPVHVIPRGDTTSSRSPVPGKVIFLNERMYDVYQTPEQYMQGLDRILDALHKGFTDVLFKFHPREGADWQQRIRARLRERHPAVGIIETTQAIEELMADQRPEVLASYFSAPLLNLGAAPVEPMFLYHLLPELAAQKVCLQLTSLLQAWRYRFVPGWDDARSGYRSGISHDGTAGRTSLAALLATATGEALTGARQ